MLSEWARQSRSGCAAWERSRGEKCLVRLCRCSMRAMSSPIVLITAAVTDLPSANSSKPNQAALQSGTHRLGAALDAELFEQCVDMQFHSALRDVKLRGNLFISLSFSDQ